MSSSQQTLSGELTLCSRNTVSSRGSEIQAENDQLLEAPARRKSLLARNFAIDIITVPWVRFRCRYRPTTTFRIRGHVSTTSGYSIGLPEVIKAGPYIPTITRFSHVRLVVVAFGKFREYLEEERVTSSEQNHTQYSRKSC
jgi:hypothetical protein